MASPPLAHQRDLIRPLLNENSPQDALAAFYALHYDPKRISLTVHMASPERADGFLVRGQTGFDLFRPLVTFRAAAEDVAVDLFREGLLRGRPVRLTVPDSLAQWTFRHLDVSDPQIMRVYTLEPGAFEPTLNVLVTVSRSPEGHPRYEIRSGQTVHAAAGLNWRSGKFAEVYVYTDPASRGRGWGRSVLSPLVGALLNDRVRPLYNVEEENAASIRLAESVGFVDTGYREFACQAIWQG